MSAFRIYLRVVSETLQPEAVSRHLGVEPDESTSIGSRRRPQSPPRSHSTWIRRAGRARPEDLEPVILAWGQDFAESLGRLAVSDDAAVCLQIVQEIRDPDDPQQMGIFLSPALLSWLAVSHASLDIDQYVYTDPQ
ncbi:DUF4279 domain-containing protein [Streptomyces sp. NPDC096136]|uniref:DUF4279 domain-containing protein n=1 Tax=Streptomyces sp. NPDC096136 TaxID=3366076 RepID=UPI003821D41A